MDKDELKAIYFSFYDQLLPEHAEKAKANYSEEFSAHRTGEHGEPKSHKDAVYNGFSWIKSEEPNGYWSEIYDRLEGGTYPLQLTPQECTRKAKEYMYGLPKDPQERKEIPIFSGCVNYFPLALAAVAKLSKKGNDQHNPDKPLHWDRSKSGDELDAMMRHVIDGDWDAVAWRALAHLQKQEEVRLSD